MNKKQKPNVRTALEQVNQVVKRQPVFETNHVFEMMKNDFFSSILFIYSFYYYYYYFVLKGFAGLVPSERTEQMSKGTSIYNYYFVLYFFFERTMKKKRVGSVCVIILFSQYLKMEIKKKKSESANWLWLAFYLFIWWNILDIPLGCLKTWSKNRRLAETEKKKQTHHMEKKRPENSLIIIGKFGWCKKKIGSVLCVRMQWILLFNFINAIYKFHFGQLQQDDHDDNDNVQLNQSK